MVEQIRKILKFSFTKFAMFIIVKYHLNFIPLDFIFLLLWFSTLIVQSLFRDM